MHGCGNLDSRFNIRSRADHRMSGVLKCMLDMQGHHSVILDDQNMHASLAFHIPRINQRMGDGVPVAGYY